MFRIPAICNDCGTIFASGFAMDATSAVSMNGVTSGPCPKCGGKGHIEDGVYRITEKVIELFSNPETTIEELYNLKDILNEYQNDSINYDEFVDRVEKGTPNLNPLLEYIQPKTRAEKFQYGLMIIGAALNLYIPILSNNEPTTNINQEIVINQIYQTTNNVHTTNIDNQVLKVGRNSICPCGSGLKYKRCHGK